MSNGKGVIRVIIDETMPISKAALERNWQAFMRGGTNHSGRGATLAAIINRADREGIPYVLTAHPGLGYHIVPGTMLH